VLLGIEPVAVHAAARGDQGLDRLAHPGGDGISCLRRLVQAGDKSG
jgi:hypothetical protein